MGFLRGFGIVILSVVLFLLLLLAGVFSTLSSSLTYDNVQPRAYTVADQIITTQIGGQEIVNKLTPYISVFCQNNSEVVQNFEGYTFVFPCDVLSQGYDSILNYSVNYLVKDFYYQEYNCTFVHCFESSKVPLFLVSDFARQHWKSLFYKTLFGIIIAIALIVLIIEKKSNAPLLVGALLVGSSLITLQLNKIGTKIAGIVLSPLSSAVSGINTNTTISQVVAMFFSNSNKVFIWMFVTGLILIAFSLVWKLTGLGFKINEKIESMKNKDKTDNAITKEDVKKVVKQEISNQNSKKNTKINKK